VNKHLDFLKKLARTRSERKRIALFKEATRSQLLTLVEISYNILRGYFKLTRRQKLRLLPYAAFVRAMSRSRSEKGARDIIQKGGGFGTFAALLTPVIIEAVKYLANRGTSNKNGQ